MTITQLLVAGLALALVIFLVVYLLLALRRIRYLERAEAQRAASQPGGARRSSAGARERVGPVSRPASTADGEFSYRADERPRTERYQERTAPSGDAATYRVRATGAGAPKWNPYAEDQSRAYRVRARRQRRMYPTPGNDYYSLLGLERGATSQEIEQAYRRYAARIHPDRFFDDPWRRAQAEKKLKELNAIMQVLRDPVRRARYDARLAYRDTETES